MVLRSLSDSVSRDIGLDQRTLVGSRQEIRVRMQSLDMHPANSKDFDRVKDG